MQKPLKLPARGEMEASPTKGFSGVEVGHPSWMTDPEEALDLEEIIDDEQFRKE